MPIPCLSILQGRSTMLPRLRPDYHNSSSQEAITHLARISHDGSGRAGLQTRRYKAFQIIPVSHAPRSPAPAGLRGAPDQRRAGAAIPAGLKPRPSGSPLPASKRGEKSGLRTGGEQSAESSRQRQSKIQNLKSKIARAPVLAVLQEGVCFPLLANHCRRPVPREDRRFIGENQQPVVNGSQDFLV